MITARTKRAARPVLARGCRLLRRSKVGRYLGYTGRDANIPGEAALDPKVTSQVERQNPL
jgi:hypothetical protein